MHMTHEPMLNLREKAPLYLFALLLVLHALRAHIIGDQPFEPLRWLILHPLGQVGISFTQNITSLLGYTLLHRDYGHVLMNGFAIVVFGIVTLQGIRADIRFKAHRLSPVAKFIIIFLAGAVVGAIFQWGLWSISGEYNKVIGASGGASALFATMAYALGGRDKMLRFGGAYLLFNIAIALFGEQFELNIAWIIHIGGFVAGMILAPIWVRPSSADFKVN